jgi:hypothetical protein
MKFFSTMNLIRFGVLAVYTALIAFFVKDFWGGLFFWAGLVLALFLVLPLIEKRLP